MRLDEGIPYDIEKWILRVYQRPTLIKKKMQSSHSKSLIENEIISYTSQK